MGVVHDFGEPHEILGTFVLAAVDEGEVAAGAIDWLPASIEAGQGKIIGAGPERNLKRPLGAGGPGLVRRTIR
jgi:hypothetical protein